MKVTSEHDNRELDALAPAIDAMLNSVRTDAASVMAASSVDAASWVGQARSDASIVLSRARADGAAGARHATGASLTAATRTGREAVLGAHRRAYEALRAGVREELARQLETSAGVAMLVRLEALARARLGPSATVERLNDGRIGIRATDGNRLLDLPLDRFVEHELEGVGERIATLWQ